MAARKSSAPKLRADSNDPVATRRSPSAPLRSETLARPLGSVIRAARRERGQTLQQLAQATDLSISFLSQVERELLTPSVSALKRIADVLGIAAGSLMFNLAERAGVDAIGLVKENMRKRVVFPGSNISYEMLTPDLRRRMSLLLLKAPPRSDSGPAFSHTGEDAVMVIRGRLDVEVGGVWHPLRKGDTLYFNSELAHRWRNPSQQISEVIWVTTPPSF